MKEGLNAVFVLCAGQKMFSEMSALNYRKCAQEQYWETYFTCNCLSNIAL